MCGICGWLDLSRQLNMGTFVKMNNIAKHRGPDDEGYLSISATGQKTLYGNDSCKSLTYDCNAYDYCPKDDASFLLLGHRRLSIIDLSPAGHQPMCDVKNHFSIVFNGEIYNYIEIREELIKKGYSFSTDTDTEVILKSYSEWGEECVSHFDGMWGFAIWDDHNKKLFCSRDRLGAKPFYYVINSEGLLFSSEIKQLCQNEKVKKILCESTMMSQIMFGITDYSEDTLIQDIKVLCGGWNLVVQVDDELKCIKEVKKYQYWDVNTADKSGADCNKMFECFEDAVRIRLRSDAPVGVLLSGGLDSSCLVSEIASIYKETGRSCSELNTFTSCYCNFEEGNEQKYAQMVNDYCGTTQNFIFPDSNDSLTDYENLIWYVEGDASIQAIGSYLLLKEISKTGTKVLINGQGADETLFGYERYYAWYFKDLLKRFRLKQFIVDFVKSNKNSKLSIAMLAKYCMYFSFLQVRKGNCLKRMKPFVSQYVIDMFKTDKSIDGYISSETLPALQYNELKYIQLTHILRMDDRLYMSHSMESRVPFIDYKYVEEAVKIPEDKKIQNGFTKYLLRTRYDSKLPSEVIWRKNKMGWPSPKERWAGNFDKNRIEKLLDTAKTNKYFNVDKLRQLLYKDPSSYAFEKFLTIELFVRAFNVEIP